MFYQPPPPPPPPPAFMTGGLPLSCFDKPNFEQDGLEFFVCNGGGGIAGVRKKNDASKTIFVQGSDIAQNLNMQVARQGCAGKRVFAVRSDRNGQISFLCRGEEIPPNEKFKPSSKADWKKYSTYLAK